MAAAAEVDGTSLSDLRGGASAISEGSGATLATTSVATSATWAAWGDPKPPTLLCFSLAAGGGVGSAAGMEWCEGPAAAPQGASGVSGVDDGGVGAVRSTGSVDAWPFAPPQAAAVAACCTIPPGLEGKAKAAEGGRGAADRLASEGAEEGALPTPPAAVPPPVLGQAGAGLKAAMVHMGCTAEGTKAGAG